MQLHSNYFIRPVQDQKAICQLICSPELCTWKADNQKWVGREERYIKTMASEFSCSLKRIREGG